MSLTPPPAPGHEPIHVVTLEDVQETSVPWIWQGWIPRKKITVLDGDPGLGKSTLLLDIAARVSTGRPMPDNSPGERGGVLLLSGEDSLEDTIKPRLRAANADLSAVHHLNTVGQGKEERPPSLPDDIDQLRQAILEYQVTLVIIDPFAAFLSSGVDSSRDRHMRRTMHQLQKLAEQAGVGLVLLRHLNKGNSTNPLYRGGGSIGIIAAARAGLVVAKSPDDPEQQILAVTKSNLARTPDAWAFRLRETPIGCCDVEWLEPVQITARELLGRSSQDPASALARAVEFLEEQLPPWPEQRPAVDIFQAAKNAGISAMTIKRAKAALPVVTRRNGAGANQQWLWSRPKPDESDPLVPQTSRAPESWEEILGAAAASRK